MTTLSEPEIRAAMNVLPGWVLDRSRITREFCLGGFAQAVAFVVRISYPAEAADHHPDLDLRYNRVRVTLSTHSEGGVTDKDLDLARVIQTIFAEGIGRGAQS